METNWTLKLRDDKSAATAKRIKREVAAMNAELRVLMELAPMASRAMGAVASPSTIRNLRTELGLLKQVNTELRRTGTERRRSERPTGQRAGGAAGGRTRQEGAFSLRQQEQLRGMRQRGIDREARDRGRAQRNTDRANRREESANAAHHRGLFTSNQRAQAWGRRQNDQARWQNERAATQRRRDQADPLGALGRRFRSSNPRAAGAMQIGGRVGGMAMDGARAVAGMVMSVVQTTLAALAAVAGLAAGFAALTLAIGHSVLQMIAFREGALMTLATLARTDGEGLRPGESAAQNARRVRAQREQQSMSDFNWSQDFARRTPLNMTQVVEMQTQAAAAGYQGAQRREMVSAAADAAALHPNDASTGSRFLLQMGQLRNSAVARSADYRPAAQAAGISETAAMRRAAIAAGVVQRNGENESAYQRRIRTAQGNGQITGRQMHDAILDEQRAQLGGGRSGTFAQSQAGSMAAVLSNLGEGFQAFVTSINAIENLPGVRALKAMLTQISDTLAGATENGVYLQTVFAKGLDMAAGMMADVFGKGGFDGALTEALAVARELYPIVRGVMMSFKEGLMEGFGPFIAELRSGAGEFMASGGHDLMQWAREFGVALARTSVWMLRITALAVQIAAMATTGLPDVAGRLRSVPSALLRVLNPLQLIADLVEWITTRASAAARDSVLPPGSFRRRVADFFGIGQDMGNGVARGFRDRQAHMQSEISAVMASLPATARTDMQIKSPSRVMAEIGQYMAEGVTMGLDSGAGGVQSAMSSVVAPPSLPGFGGGMGGGAPITVDVGGIHINGAQDTGAVVEELRSKMEEMFVGLFERAQLMAGA